LLRGVRRLGTGKLDARVSGDFEGEIGELASAFNEMAERLQASFHRERDLVTMVSHDLRTPLASIRAMIEAINDGVVSDAATIERYHWTIQSEVVGLSHLVIDLFELSQIDAGMLKLHIDECAVEELISETVDMMAPEAAQRHLVLTGELNQQVPPVAIDAHRIQRVLYNLVQNAIRHTPPDGAISIRAEDIGAEVKVEVSDTGGGISPEDLRHLFQTDDSQTHPHSSTPSGTGLGLKIAKGIVEAHGGHIWVESQSGQGSVFSFTLPKASMPSHS